MTSTTPDLKASFVYWHSYFFFFFFLFLLNLEQTFRPEEYIHLSVYQASIDSNLLQTILPSHPIHNNPDKILSALAWWMCTRRKLHLSFYPCILLRKHKSRLWRSFDRTPLLQCECLTIYLWYWRGFGEGEVLCGVGLGWEARYRKCRERVRGGMGRGGSYEGGRVEGWKGECSFPESSIYLAWNSTHQHPPQHFQTQNVPLATYL